MTFQEFSTVQIKQNGGRITKSKLALIKLLEEAHTPLTPYVIADKLNRSGKNIDVVTVYRILETLEGLELVHKSEKGFTRCLHHECAESKHCHHLFTCSECNSVKEIHLDDRKFLASINEKFKELLINSHSFQFSGLCENCQK